MSGGLGLRGLGFALVPYLATQEKGKNFRTALHKKGLELGKLDKT